MRDENPKRTMGAGGFLPKTGPPPGLYLLYVNGAGTDFEEVERAVAKVPNHPLGPMCWLVLPAPQGIREFADAVSMAMPSAAERAEVLLCHLSGSTIFHNNQDGWGAVAWLKKHLLTRT